MYENKIKYLTISKDNKSCKVVMYNGDTKKEELKEGETCVDVVKRIIG